MNYKNKKILIIVFAFLVLLCCFVIVYLFNSPKEIDLLSINKTTTKENIDNILKKPNSVNTNKFGKEEYVYKNVKYNKVVGTLSIIYGDDLNTTSRLKFDTNIKNPKKLNNVRNDYKTIFYNADTSKNDIDSDVFDIDNKIVVIEILNGSNLRINIDNKFQ